MANKNRVTSTRKTIMDYGQTKFSQVLPGTTYYVPTIKELYSGQIFLVDELKKNTVDRKYKGLYIYIVNMTEPGTKRQ